MSGCAYVRSDLFMFCLAAVLFLLLNFKNIFELLLLIFEEIMLYLKCSF